VPDFATDLNREIVAFGQVADKQSMTKPSNHYVHLIYGEDEYSVTEAAKTVVDQVVSEEDREFGLEIVEGNARTSDEAAQAIMRCMESLQTLSLLGGVKLVWFRDCTFLGDSSLGRSETVKERLEQFVRLIKDGLSDGHQLLVSAAKVDKRFAFFKACVAAGTVEEHALASKPYQQDREGMQRLVDVLNEHNLEMAEPVREAFHKKVGNEPRQIVNEVSKLAIFVHGRESVSIDDVDLITSRSSSALAWDLADAAGERDLPGALSILRLLLFQREPAIGLVIALENRYRDLIIFREALDRGWLQLRGGGRPSAKWTELSADATELLTGELGQAPAKVHPYRLLKLVQQAAQYGLNELVRARRLAVLTHERLVTVSISEEIVLELLLIRLLGGRRQA
jgi:DNA polymerase-3 subunit delta